MLAAPLTAMSGRIARACRTSGRGVPQGVWRGRRVDGGAGGAGRHPHPAGPTTVRSWYGVTGAGNDGGQRESRGSDARAERSEPSWSYDDPFHSWIMANLPAPRRTALDVGCGRGELLALLITVLEDVAGTDRDGGMRGQAATRCAGRTARRSATRT